LIFHVRRQIRVKIDVTRLALLVSLVCLPLLGDGGDLNALLQCVEQRYNRAKTLQVSFNETYTINGRARKSESGSLTLRKPGRMRWDYAVPPGKLFLSDGHDVYVYTPDTKRVEKVKLKESEDMRAPLAFLLGKLDFGKEFRDFEIRQEGSNFVLAAKAKSEKLPYERIEMLVSADYQIQRLVIKGQDQSILTFLFTEEKLNPQLNDAQFKFKMPPGATLVAGEGSQ